MPREHISPEILQVVDLHSRLSQHLDGLRPLQAQGRVQELEILRRELAADGVDLRLVVVAETPEDVVEDVADSV